MITRESLNSLLEELFPENEVHQFSIDWILDNPTVTEESIKEVYNFLKRIGLEDEKIASQAHLLGMNPETIERNYQRLKSLGLKDEKIASRAELLGRKPETIERNYKSLQKLGLRDSKIATLAQLLGRKPETIERNYQRLKSLGLKDEKIASQAQLLGRNPETIEKNYQHHVGLLRRDYKNRVLGRYMLTNQPHLLEISPETIEANVQFLYSLDIDYHNSSLLGTKTKCKRKKMAWMLRELFDYRTLSEEQRREAIDGLYNFIRDDPKILTKSINSLERERDKLREKVAQYKI